LVVGGAVLLGRLGGGRVCLAVAPGREGVGGDALRRKRKVDFAFQVVIPTHRLLFGTIGVRDGFFVNPIFPDNVSAGFAHADRGAQRCGSNSSRRWIECDPIRDRTS
jgi:hypothetical protein